MHDDLQMNNGYPPFSITYSEIIIEGDAQKMLNLSSHACRPFIESTHFWPVIWLTILVLDSLLVDKIVR